MSFPVPAVAAKQPTDINVSNIDNNTTITNQNDVVVDQQIEIPLPKSRGFHEIARYIDKFKNEFMKNPHRANPCKHVHDLDSFTAVHNNKNEKKCPTCDIIYTKISPIGYLKKQSNKYIGELNESKEILKKSISDLMEKLPNSTEKAQLSKIVEIFNNGNGVEASKQLSDFIQSQENIDEISTYLEISDLMESRIRELKDIHKFTIEKTLEYVKQHVEDEAASSSAVLTFKQPMINQQNILDTLKVAKETPATSTTTTTTTTTSSSNNTPANSNLLPNSSPELPSSEDMSNRSSTASTSDITNASAPKSPEKAMDKDKTTGSEEAKTGVKRALSKSNSGSPQEKRRKLNPDNEKTSEKTPAKSDQPNKSQKESPPVDKEIYDEEDEESKTADTTPSNSSGKSLRNSNPKNSISRSYELRAHRPSMITPKKSSSGNKSKTPSKTPSDKTSKAPAAKKSSAEKTTKTKSDKSSTDTPKKQQLSKDHVEMIRHGYVKIWDEIITQETVGLIDENKDTLLHHVVRYYKRLKTNDSGDLFKKFGANFDAKNNKKNTPLHVAVIVSAEDDNVDLIKDLLSFGARADIVNGEGKTPVKYAKEASRIQWELKYWVNNS